MNFISHEDEIKILFIFQKSLETEKKNKKIEFVVFEISTPFSKPFLKLINQKQDQLTKTYLKIRNEKLETKHEHY